MSIIVGFLGALLIGTLIRWLYQSLISRTSIPIANSLFDGGMSIYSSSSVKLSLSELCTKALERNAFHPHGNMQDGSNIISFAVDGLAYVGLIDVQHTEGIGDALIVSAVYPVGPEGLTKMIASLKAL